MTSQPTAVLVHGAFADASGFAEVIRHLQAQAVAVRAPMNPLRGLASDAEAIVPYDAPGAVGGPDLFIKIEQFHETFCADLGEDVAGPMAVSQRPLAAAAYTEAATAVGWRDVRSWYLVSEHDNAIPPDCERFMAQRMNAVTESVDASHVAFMSKPDVASGLILKALASL
jgi:pimeloyl-ACP methyl ester carboxylesterase